MLLSVNDICFLTNASAHTVRKWIKTGRLIGKKRNNREGYQVEPEAFFIFLQNSKEYRQRLIKIQKDFHTYF